LIALAVLEAVVGFFVVEVVEGATRPTVVAGFLPLADRAPEDV